MTLLEEIQSGPKAAQLAPLIAAEDWDAAATLLSEGRTVLTERKVWADTILSELPITGNVQGGTVLNKLDAAGASIPACRWAVACLVGMRGINVGDPNTQAMLDMLVAANVLTSAEANALKALARQPAPVSAQEIYNAVQEGA